MTEFENYILVAKKHNGFWRLVIGLISFFLFGQFNIAPGGLHRWMGIKVSGVAVVPAQVALVHRSCVMPGSAVVTAVVETGLQRGRQFQLFGDLTRGQALVEQAHGLILQVFVSIALHFQEIDEFKLISALKKGLDEANTKFANKNFGWC